MSNGGAHDDALLDQPSLIWLKSTLMHLSPGSVVNLVYEPDLNLLRQRGRVWRGDKTVMKPGPHRGWCHANTVELFRSDPLRIRMATGWALARGVWVQHSWGIVNNRVVETTDIERDMYFGFVMDRQEARNFAASTQMPGD